MLIILFVVCLALFIATLFIVDEYDCEWRVISALPLVCVIIAAAVLCGNIVNGRVIDEKIAMCEAENAEIIESMNMLVSNYMEHEKSTFTELKGDSAITLVSLYPELKSDELVKMQIETYQNNVQEIKKMKMDKINISNCKWWLYFGG